MNEFTDERLHKIGSKLKEIRIQKGFGSYVAFAIEHELGRNYYWEVEKGRNVTLQYLFKILDIHDIRPAEFFKDID